MPDGTSERRLALHDAVRLTRPTVALWTVVSAATFFGFLYGCTRVLEPLGAPSVDPVIVDVAAVPDLTGLVVGALALVVFVVIPHELCHGIVMARFDADPRYGVDLSRFLFPHAYARTDGTGFTRNQLLAVALAPLVALTVLGVVAYGLYPTPWLVVALAVNAAGSVGDCWTAATLLRYPPSVRVAGLPGGEPGYGVYSPRDEPVDRPHRWRAVSAFVLGAVVTFSALVVFLFALVLTGLASGAGTVVVGDPDGAWFLFGHEYAPRDGFAVVRVGERAVVAITVLGGAVWAGVDALLDRLGGGGPATNRNA